MRRLRDSMWEMNRSDIPCSVCSSLTICSFPTISTTVGVIAVALPIRSGWPARHPSPKKSVGPSIATTASRPLFESTESLTPPDWMYMTCRQTSPCVKIVSPRENSTTDFEIFEAERNARVSNKASGFGVFAAGLAGFRAIPHDAMPADPELFQTAQNGGP